MRLLGVGCANHCKFKTVVVVIFATLLENKEPKIDTSQKNKLSAPPKEKENEEEGLDDEW